MGSLRQLIAVQSRWRERDIIAPARMALAPGTKLGQYEIVAPLGAGGMGEVYRARDPQLGRDVAIKILPTFLSHDPDRMRRFEQEARAAAALNHPNILSVYQMGSQDGTSYLVSELLEGSTLRDLLLRGPVPVRKAVDYATQVAHGLAAAHEKGIVHRDLKPENLFLTKDGRMKILDFGLAKIVQPSPSAPATPTMTEGTEPGVVLGTAGYMSPEQVRGEIADGRADLFALGAIVHELLTGKRAFHKPTSAETMTAILNEDPPSISQILPTVPPALQKVVQRCLEKTPQQRFHSASDLAFALEALSDSGSAPSVLLPPASTQLKRRWIATVVITLAILTGLAFWLTRAPANPSIESITQLTNDGQVKLGSMEADASRIYFNEGPEGSYRIAQVSINGGQTGEIATGMLNPTVSGLSADGSSLLVLSGGFFSQIETMWLVPLPVGQARRLVDSAVLEGGLFPDGRVLYRTETGLFVASKDAADPRKLDELSKLRVLPRVSPDGKHFAFIRSESNGWTIEKSLADGTAIQTILRSGPDLPAEVCCLRWADEGRYLVFRARFEGRWDLWAVPSERSFLARNLLPARLTNGPLSYTTFAGSRDRNQIFAVGNLLRGEIQHYDEKSRRFVPFLGGISAVDPTFSRDGKWVAYQAYPEHTLWRSRTDGSERLQLTYPPVFVSFARISPDGTKVAFSDRESNVYMVSIDGGSPKKVYSNAVAPDWSPDSNLLVLTVASGSAWKPRVMDVRDGSITEIADSHDALGAWFGSQDTLIATRNDQSTFATYDLKTQKWSELVSSPDKFVTWETSPDFKYFIYSTGGSNPAAYRIRLPDGKPEEVVSLKNFKMVDDAETGPTMFAAPDNSVLVTRDIGTQEVYAISVKWP